MDPCSFMRIVVGNLAFKFSGGNPPPPSGCYCKIKLKNSTTQIADVDTQVSDKMVQACFNFKKSEFDRRHKSMSNRLKIELYSSSGRKNPFCGVGSSGKLLGVVSLSLESNHNGWVAVDDYKKKKSRGVELHLNVRVEPDPRFVFEFDGEPECSPQVFQVNGSVRQAVFTCKFNNNLLRSGSGSGSGKLAERKGWSVTIHDLTGSPVAMASMVTPFVPSHGSHDVGRSNPGAWLILRPGHNTWKPWGRLEAWRESAHELGYRFELLPEAAIAGGQLDPITLSNSTISTSSGGKFSIDIIGANYSPMIITPSGSFDSGSGSGSWSGSDFWSGSWEGFVMSSKVGCSNPEVEIGVDYVTCREDAAAFVALAAAVDLSVDACQPFSRKLRKELRPAE